jgi:cytochrome c-type biogenesis protein CcmH/NrfG
MSTAVAPYRSPNLVPAVDRPIRILPIPWRDPHSVSPAELAEHIAVLEQACLEHPQSSDLRTCLGMAYAMNFDVYKSMDALEEARSLDETHFFAQFKYAELLYRLRALPRAEDETKKAIDLAGNGWELSMARKQLQEIRALIREGTQKPEWTKPLWRPSLALVLMFVLFSAIAVIYR